MVRRERARVALVTSHPLSPPWDSADKHLAALVARTLTDYRFLSVRRAGDRSRALPGRRMPVVSGDGRPGLLQSVQIGAFTAAVLPSVDLLHLVVTIGPNFARLARALRRAPAAVTPPVLHTVPGVVDASSLSPASGDDHKLGTTVVLTQHSGDLLTAAGFDDVRVIPPSVPLERWPVTARPQGAPVVLFAGHYDEGGGAETAVDAFGASAFRDSARLVLAMRTRPGQDEIRLAQGLRERAAAAGIEQMEILGRVSDMPAVIRQASLVILPATSLAGKADVPVTVLEAMASGRPVVVSDLPSMVSALGEAAIWVRPEPLACGRAISELLSTEALWAERARSGRRLVERQFSEAAASHAYAELYTELLESSGRRAH